MSGAWRSVRAPQLTNAEKCVGAAPCSRMSIDGCWMEVSCAKSKVNFFIGSRCVKSRVAKVGLSHRFMTGAIGLAAVGRR